MAATQRMTFFMHVLELMSVAGRLPGSICSRPCRCRQRQPAHLSEIDNTVASGFRLVSERLRDVRQRETGGVILVPWNEDAGWWPLTKHFVLEGSLARGCPMQGS